MDSSLHEMPSDFAEGSCEDSVQRLTDYPDLLYMLREFDYIYRYGSAGGSKLIRSHRRRVRQTLSRLMEGNAEVSPRQPAPKPVTAHLNRALDLGDRGAMAGISRGLRNLTSQLTWEYGYERVPKSLSQKYAYCEIAGPRGPVKSDQIVIGFVLFAPKTTYPQHSHHDIEESYISVAGAWSENDIAVHAPGSLILNLSGREHRITTADLEPCLLAYAWLGPEHKLHSPGMKLNRSRKIRMQHGI